MPPVTCSRPAPRSMFGNAREQAPVRCCRNHGRPVSIVIAGQDVHMATRQGGTARMAHNDGKHCLWCGRTLTSSGTLYCNAGHRTKQREHRGKVAGRRPETCPTPTKVSFPHRGTAFRAAAIHRQYAYLCACGVYHLTPDPGRRGRRTDARPTIGRRSVTQLARDLNRTGSAHSRRRPPHPRSSDPTTACRGHQGCTGGHGPHHCSAA